MQSKYGFDANCIEYIEALVAYIRKVNEGSFIKAQWSDGKVHYDNDKDCFIATAGYSFLPIKRTIPDNDVYRAIENLQKDFEVEIQKEDLQDKYTEAVNYFHHDAKIDDKGIFIKSGVLSKKYFSLAELDDMNEKYLKRKHSK